MDLDQRRQQFLSLISAYSEDRWCAGWMTGIEKDIRNQGGCWLALACACGGWPVGYNAEDGWDPLTQEEINTALNFPGFK